MKDWNELSTKDKAAFMGIAVRNGITDMDTIKNIYGSIGDNNVMANGGNIQTQQQPVEQPTQFSLYARLKERRKANRFDPGGPAGHAGDVWKDYLENNKDYSDDIIHPIESIQSTTIIPKATQSEFESVNFNPTSGLLENIQGADGVNLSNLSAGKEIKFRPSLGQATQNLGNKLTDKASSLLGGNASGLVNTGLGVAGSLANKGFSKLFSNGLSSGAGNAIGNIGGTIGSLVGSVNPVLGAGISAATGILGGLTNAAFGSKLNQEHIAAVENSNTMLNNTKISSNDTTSALNDISSINWGADFTKRDIGRDGWFANKANKKYNELSDAQTLARSRAMSASDTAVSNIATNQRRSAMANFSAYGGPVNKYDLGSAIIQANDDYINAFGRPDWIPLRAVYPTQQQQKKETPVVPQETQQQIPLSNDWNWFVDNIINGNLHKNYGIDTNDWRNQMMHSFDGTAVDYRTSFNNLMSSNANVVGDIYNTLISKGFTPAQASGALGNIMVESRFKNINAKDPTKNNPNNIARGYFQMGDLETKNFNKWKQRTALAADTPSHIAQAMYVADMLNGGGYDYLGYVPGHEKTTKQQARDWFNSTNPADAATGFMLRYEKPGKPNENLRRAYADLFYNYYGNQSKYGGKINKYNDGGIKNSIAKQVHKYSAAAMDMFASHTGKNPQKLSFFEALLPYLESPMQYGAENKDEADGALQSTYLLPRWMQEEIMKDYGYKKGEEGDYGPTADTVHRLFGDVPVWQTAPHVIDADRVVSIGLLANEDNPYSPWYAKLHNAGSYYTTLGIDPVTNTFIGDSYDLNNYGDDGNGDGGAYSEYPLVGKIVANLLDKVGSPIVVTTGRQPLVDPETHQMYHYGDNSYLPRDIVEPLDEFFANQNMPQYRLDNSFLWALPNVTVTPEKKKHGGKINRFDKGGNQKKK